MNHRRRCLFWPCAAIALSLVIALAPSSTAGEVANPSIRIGEAWANHFAGAEVVYHVSVSSGRPIESNLTWSLKHRDRELASGQENLDLAANKPATATVSLRLPDVRVVVPAELAISADRSSTTRKLWVFPKDPFRDRQRWLKELRIRLFDPESSTTKVLGDAGIPYEAVRDVDQLSGIESGVLLIGAETSLKDYRGLWQATTELASKEVTVLYLNPSAGVLELPTGDSEGILPPASLRLADSRVVREFDPRFDIASWRPNGESPVVSRVRLIPDRRRILGEIGPTSQGWPWLELDYAPKRGRVIVCGLSIIRSWNDSPVPRYLLLRLLEQADENSRQPSVRTADRSKGALP